MDDACRQIANVMIFLFQQKQTSLTGFRVPIFEPHVEPVSSRLGAPSYLKSSPKVFDFLENRKLQKQKTKLSLVLMPRNDKLKLKCPIEIARLSVKLVSTEPKTKTIDHFCEIDMAEADKPDELAARLNQVMAALVSGCLLSPFIGLDTMRSLDKKKRMVAQKFWVTFEVTSSEITDTASVFQEKRDCEEGCEGIIVISPERTLESDAAESEAGEAEPDLDDDLEELDKCTKQSRDGSEDFSDQPFFGKTHSLHWSLRSGTCAAEISLLVHDNLNSICSFIKKTHLDEKSQKNGGRGRRAERRNRFLSEEIQSKVKFQQRTRPERNHSFFDLPRRGDQLKMPFRILKDQLVEECLGRRPQGRPVLTPQEYSRVALVAREERGPVGGSFVDSRWKLVSKTSLRETNAARTPESEAKGASLKQMFQMSTFLKTEIRREMRIRRKRLRCSGKSIKLKRSGQVLRNYFSEQKTPGLSEKYLSIRECTEGARKSSEKTPQTRGSPRGSEPGRLALDREGSQGRDAGQAPSRQFHTLIKFKRAG